MGNLRLWKVVACWWALGASAALAAQLDVVTVPGEMLRDNPLGDPAKRPAAVFSPDGVKPTTPLPLVIYLPGWGGSSEDAIASGRRDLLGVAVDELAAGGLKLRIATVDARSRYGGSQYVNSTATGRYGDYVAREVYDLLRERFATNPGPAIIAGHSSGGYGALMLAMAWPERFSGVVALSPDSHFQVTHLELVRQPGPSRLSLAEVARAMAPRSEARQPQDGLAALVVGLCANYAPTVGQPGKFEWLYDGHSRWRPEVWQRWLEADPLTHMRKRADAFKPRQRIYLDGPERDAFKANLGTAAMYEVLKTSQAAVTLSTPPGGHNDQLLARLVAGLRWITLEDASRKR